MSDFEVRDLRSASHASKRAKDVSAKYNYGKRILVGDLRPTSSKKTEQIDTPREHFKKTRPADLVHPIKPRQNSTSKTVQLCQTSQGHVGPFARKNGTVLDSQDDESPSMHRNFNLSASNPLLAESVDSAILYSFEDQGKSPNENGREVGLDKLVDRAEEEWESGQTDRMLKEYEVLDRKGGKTRLSARKGKIRGSQSQGGGSEVAEEEGFEVI